MTQQLDDSPGPTEPVVRDVTVSVIDVSVLTPEVRALLRVRGRLTALEAAEFYGPARLPRVYSSAQARDLVEDGVEAGLSSTLGEDLLVDVAQAGVYAVRTRAELGEGHRAELSTRVRFLDLTEPGLEAAQVT